MRTLPSPRALARIVQNYNERLLAQRDLVPHYMALPEEEQAKHPFHRWILEMQEATAVLATLPQGTDMARFHVEVILGADEITLARVRQAHQRQREGKASVEDMAMLQDGELGLLPNHELSRTFRAWFEQEGFSSLAHGQGIGAHGAIFDFTTNASEKKVLIAAVWASFRKELQDSTIRVRVFSAPLRALPEEDYPEKWPWELE